MLKRLLAIFVLLASTGGLLTASSPASTPIIFTPSLPVSAELTTVPLQVSWPDSRDFEYRVRLKAGEAGGHFVFTVPLPGWGFRGVYGSPFALGPQPSLQGPGTLKRVFSVVADPAPWACWRGAFAGTQVWYEMTLEPGDETTVVVPARLAAAPLRGMATDTHFRIENGDDPILVDADIEVAGKPGVRIMSRISGSDPKFPAKRRAGGHFVLRGFTRPALANRRIHLKATPVLTRSGKPLRPYRIATVRTDGDGRFKSKPLKVKPATWSFTSRLASAGRFARESSCGPPLVVKPRR